MEFTPAKGGRGISREKLAADAGVDRAYLGGLERQTENPTVDLLDKIADSQRTNEVIREGQGRPPGSTACG